MLNDKLFFFINSVAVYINFYFEFIFFAVARFFARVVSDAVLIAKSALMLFKTPGIRLQRLPENVLRRILWQKYSSCFAPAKTSICRAIRLIQSIARKPVFIQFYRKDFRC